MTALPAHPAAGLFAREVGQGAPVLVLHGAYSSGTEMAGFLTATLRENRLLLPDLPGHGGSPGDGVDSCTDVVDRLDAYVEAALGSEPFAVIGHSYGAHIARALAARRPHQVNRLALICPLVPDDEPAEPPTVVTDDGSADSLPDDLAKEFRDYFVVRTAATLARFTDAVVPALGPHDAEAIDRQLEHPDLDTNDTGADRPTLILTGRRDAWVGYRQHRTLVAAYPRATSIIVADAGHALPHERPSLVAAALVDWIAQN